MKRVKPAEHVELRRDIDELSFMMDSGLASYPSRVTVAIQICGQNKNARELVRKAIVDALTQAGLM